jgi:hypothetical protein
MTRNKFTHYSGGSEESFASCAMLDRSPTIMSDDDVHRRSQAESR